MFTRRNDKRWQMPGVSVHSVCFRFVPGKQAPHIHGGPAPPPKTSHEAPNGYHHASGNKAGDTIPARVLAHCN